MIEVPIARVGEISDSEGARARWYDRLLTRVGLKSRDSIRDDLEEALAEIGEDELLAARAGDAEERARLPPHPRRRRDGAAGRYRGGAVRGDARRLARAFPHRRPLAPAGVRRDPRRPEGHGSYPRLPRLHRGAGRGRQAEQPGETRREAAEPRRGRPLGDALDRQDPSARALRPTLDAGGRSPRPNAGDAHPYGAW